MARPMLDDLELQQVQTIEVDGDQVWVQHGIPALEGDFLQGLGRRASQVTLTGVLTGAEVADSLKKLRDKFRAAAPVTFVADIATAIRLEQVLIEEMGVRELAGRPARFEYAFTLREFTPATPTEIIIPPPPPPPPPPRTLESVLEVEVIVEGDPNFDHAQTTVRVQGTDENGGAVDRTLPNDDPAVRQGNLWTVNPFPAGAYTVTATTQNPQMTGSAQVTLPLGETRRAVIVLRQGQTIATAFVIHYTFDRAFVEPCMRHVLRQVADFAAAHRDQRLIIVGHTDESGSDTYNQSLSERRSRGAHAFLTFGRDAQSADAAVAEWNELRQSRPGGVTLSVRDSWGVREYQHMLQDLGFYSGRVHSTHDAATDQAVRDFQTANGLNPDGVVGDQTWPVLIRAYMAQDPLSVPEDQFMPNADPADGCDHGFVHWLGCGEKMPVPSTPRGGCGDPAWRPNRRTELLFVRASIFPCEVAEPVTFNLTPAGGTGWCLGPGDPAARCCFLTRDPEEQDKFLVQPAESGSFVVQGRIRFEDGTPLANTEYVLIAPDGEFMNGEVTCADPSGARKGTPLPGRTDADGNLTDSAGNIGYPNNPKGPGVYTLAIGADVVARAEGEPLSAAKGPNVCQRLDGSAPFNVVVVTAGSLSCQLLSRVHFEFSKSFIRPAGKRALREIAAFMQNTPASSRLLPVGHTDLVGGDAFNDGLGERRAKAAFGFLTGNPPDPDNPVRSIWLNLHRDPREGWGANEIQYMLLDLGFYCHHVTAALDAETNRAIRAFKNSAGLGDNSIIDDVFLEALFAAYIAHNGAAVPAARFLPPHNFLSCSEDHPLDVRGGAPFAGRSELNRRVEFVTFPNPPNPAPTSRTDCAAYPNWLTPCEPRWVDFVGPKRNPADPADAEEFLAFLEVANWQNAFDFDPPDGNGHRHPTGDAPRADFIDRDPDRFFVQITDTDRRGAGTIRARIRTVDENDAAVNPPVEFELQENPDRPGVFRSHDVANGRPNPMLLVADEIDNGEINNGSAAGATPFRARGIANGALNDPVHRAAIGGQVVIDYQGSELGRIPVCDPECIRTIPMNIVILRRDDGTADGAPVTTEADVQERVRRLQQTYMQAGIRFDVTIRTVARLADMPAGVILSGVSGLSVSAGIVPNRAGLDPEERALIESALNVRTAAGGGRLDTLQVFYANRIDGVAATAVSLPRIKYAAPAPGDDDIMNVLLIGADDPEENSTLPHEVMHILTNAGHDAFSVFRTNVFFEQAIGQINFADTTVTSNKRIPEEQCEIIMNNVSGLVPDRP